MPGGEKSGSHHPNAVTVDAWPSTAALREYQLAVELETILCLSFGTATPPAAYHALTPGWFSSEEGWYHALFPVQKRSYLP